MSDEKSTEVARAQAALAKRQAENEVARLIAEGSKLRKRIAELEAALREIAKGEGAFSRDQLTHAENCIDNMKSIAQEALQGKAGVSRDKEGG